VPYFFWSQEPILKAIATKNNLSIGEPTIISLGIDIPANETVDTVSFQLSYNDTLGNNWELWSKSEIKKNIFQNEDGSYINHYEQEFTIANFDTGSYELPPAIAIVGNKEYLSDPLQFTIQFVDVENENKIKPIKPIKKVTIQWWEYVLFYLKKLWPWLVGLTFIIIGIYLLVKKLNKRTIKKLDEPSIPIEVLLLKKLEILESKKYWENGKYKKYYSGISEILWKFLSHRYGVKTFEKTSAEILDSLKWTEIPTNYNKEIQRFFEISDGVKFAKLYPLEKDNIQAIKMTRSLIESQRTDLIEKEEIPIEKT